LLVFANNRQQRDPLHGDHSIDYLVSKHRFHERPAFVPTTKISY
jgi:hypothetical protein